MSKRTWDLFVELRKELVESQRIRSQILGFKITFVSAFVALLEGSDSAKILFVIPAFASICFDYIIHSYSFSIKRIGGYIRNHIEKQLIKDGEFDQDFVSWQCYLQNPETKQNLVLYGNFGFTLLVSIVAGYALWSPFLPVFTPMLIAALVIALFADIYAYLSPRKLGEW